jgi:Mor family transcriptional regulator
MTNFIEELPSILIGSAPDPMIDKIATLIQHHFGGQSVYISKPPKPPIKEPRNAEIRNLMSSGMSIRELSTTYSLSDVQIRRIVTSNKNALGV